MIPYAGNSPHSPHNSKEGAAFMFNILGALLTGGWVFSGVFDSQWDNWGLLVFGGLCLGMAQLIKRN